MSNLQSLKGLQRARERQKSLEEKTKLFEENARIAKLSIDKQLFVQILQEMDRAHNDVIRELEEKLQEENRTHDDASKELRKKIADLEQQIKSASKVGSISKETPHEDAQEVTESEQETSEPEQEMSKHPQEISTEVDDSVRISAVQEHLRAVLQDYKQSQSDVPPETPKKKKRNFF